MKPLDLSGIKRFVEESLMVDECMITRKPAGMKQDIWDKEEGEYYPGEDPLLVYQGKCYVGGAWQPNETTEGGVQVVVETNFLHIPLEADPVQEGDHVVITHSLRHPHWTGKVYRAGGHDFGTHKIKQKVHIRRSVRRAQR